MGAVEMMLRAEYYLTFGNFRVKFITSVGINDVEN